MAKHQYYAPEYLIKINDKPIPAALRAAISRVNWNCDIDAADKFDFSVHDPNQQYVIYVCSLYSLYLLVD